MQLIFRLLLCMTLLFSAASLRGQDESNRPKDAEDCADSPLLGRIAGSVLRSCDNREVGQATMPLGNDEDGKYLDKTVEGEYQYWDYMVPEGLDDAEIFSSLESALQAAGFVIDFSATYVTITAHKQHTWCLLQHRGASYNQIIVNVPEKPFVIASDASALAREINEKGRVAVYGLIFATDQAELQAGSERQLGEIIQLLKQNALLRIRIDGYTDNVGNAAC